MFYQAQTVHSKQSVLLGTNSTFKAECTIGHKQHIQSTVFYWDKLSFQSRVSNELQVWFHNLQTAQSTLPPSAFFVEPWFSRPAKSVSPGAGFWLWPSWSSLTYPSFWRRRSLCGIFFKSGSIDVSLLFCFPCVAVPFLSFGLLQFVQYCLHTCIWWNPSHFILIGLARTIHL